ncbi:MAG: hypothetical protein FJ301_06715 [Planctomycetes bacterium]|nr:hypothetical protein [Planctomycetota bacterium]
MQTTGQVSPFGWNAAGWCGALLGSTIWLLILGVGVFAEDFAAGTLAFAGFAALNLWGSALWRRRDRLSAYSGLQWMMVGLLVVFAAVVLIMIARVPSIPLPYWAIAVPLPLMAMFWLRQQAARGPNTA